MPKSRISAFADQRRKGDNFALALDLADAGIPVFPCHAGGAKAKAPLTEKGFLDATTDEMRIRRWWKRFPDAVPGIPTGKPSGISILDLDRKNGKDGVAALEAMGLHPEAVVEVRTPSGGWHLIFRHRDGLKSSVDQIAPGADVRGEGGYIIAPGAVMADGTSYRLDRGDLINDVDRLTAWPADLLPSEREFDAEEEDREPVGLSQEEAQTMLDALPAEFGNSRDEWRTVGMGLHHEFGNEGFSLFDEWASKRKGYGGYHDQLRQWRSFRSDRAGEVVTIRSTMKAARESGWTMELPFDPAEFDEDDNGNLPAKPAAEIELRKGKLMLTEKGIPKPTLHNAILFARKADQKKGLGLHHDLMTGRDEWRGGLIGDAELALMRVAIEQTGMENVGAELTALAVRAVAKEKAHHPVRDWLSGVHHDGKSRLDGWLSDYLGAEDSPYVRAVGRAFLVAMVARVMRPGCKHDAVMVLGGPQGIGKSQACAVLGGAWFGDNLPSIREGSKEAGLYLQGHWLVELAELAPSRKTEAEDLKSFLSRGFDEIRAPYARKADVVPRQCVFVGTTNDHAYLRDPTGNRRFWPVDLKEGIRLEALQRDRSQLFAEALDAFNAGEAWHLSPEIETLAREAQEAVTEEDSWLPIIRAYIRDEERVQLGDLLEHIGIAAARQRPVDTHRAGALMRKLGWEKRHNRKGKFWARA